MGKTHQYRMFNVLNCFSRIPLSDEKDSNLVLIILFPQLCSGGKWYESVLVHRSMSFL